MDKNNRVIKSYVWHNDKCYFVSTIERTYDTYFGSFSGHETIAWEFDWDTQERGKIVYQGGGLMDHLVFCRIMSVLGEVPNEDNPNHERFFK